ncbi:inositol monophosphatase family protein [Helicobacter sp. T3_23-1059]
MTYSSLLAQSEFLNGCVRAGGRLAKILAKRGQEMFVRHSRGAGGDISIGADLLCEGEFCNELLTIASIDSEESGLIKCSGQSSDIIVLDPLDGSDNYKSNIPYYGASLALCDKNGEVKEACIINFCSGEVFYDRLLWGDFGLKNSASASSDNTHSTKSSAQSIHASHTKSSKQLSYVKFHLFREEILRSFVDSGLDKKAVSQEGQDGEQNLQNLIPKCGIFERAYCNPSIVARLHTHHIKFRSLGAGALSWVYALEARFLLLGGKSRRYDAMAGQFLARDLHTKEIVDKNGSFFLLVSKYKEVFDIVSNAILE